MTESEVELCSVAYKDGVYKRLDQEAWGKYLKDKMISLGWTCDIDNETTLGFSLIDGKAHWMRDYNKKTRSFVQMNGNQVVNLRMSKE